MSKITIKRLSAYGDALRSYKIFVDDKKVLKIDDNEQKEIELSVGTHTIYAQIDWFKSKVISFNINEDKSIHFNIKSNFSFLKLSIAMIIGLLVPKWLIKTNNNDVFLTYFLQIIMSISLIIAIMYMLHLKDKYISIKIAE
jgi:hypothetical protein